ncbi:PEP-utilizing enzyme [Shigella sonnei]
MPWTDATSASSYSSKSTVSNVSRYGKPTLAICMADERPPASSSNWIKITSKVLLLKSGGTTSHTVILARSFNIPTLVGGASLPSTPWQHQTIYIDGNAGAIVVEPGNPWPVIISKKPAYRTLCVSNSVSVADPQARTADGIRIEIAANIAHSVEAQAAFGNGAEGVGLLRI